MGNGTTKLIYLEQADGKKQNVEDEKLVKDQQKLNSEKQSIIEVYEKI